MPISMKRFLHVFACLALMAAPACGGKPPPQPWTPERAPRAAERGSTPSAPVAGEAQREAEDAWAKAPDIAQVPMLKVGLLLPLSGESAKLGAAMLDAAMLSLYDKYLSLPPERQTVRLVLIPKDTGTTPVMAEKAMRAALDEGAELIIGPVFSHFVTATAPIARDRGVNVLTFSNNAAVAGGNVYVFGFIPAQQVDRIAKFATARGVQRFAAFGPNDAYGQSVTRQFLDTVTARGGISRARELYASRRDNLEAAAARLAENYTASEESDRFEALFIPEGGQQLLDIIAALRGRGLDPSGLRLLGTGLWDEADVRQSRDLHGGWFASSPPEMVDWFNRRFTAAYHYQPPRLAGLAYDAVALAAAMALAPEGAGFTSARLTDPRGYVGPANGLFRFHADGTSERGLAVMEVTPAGFKVIDPAPKSF